MSLLVAEAGTRLFSAVERPLDARDPVIGKKYEPHYTGTVYVEECRCDVLLRFNREGFRGADLPYEKAGGVHRVAVIGDSMVAAVATAEEQTLVRRLEDLLNAAPPAGTARWEALNFGVSGASTAQELVLYRERVRRYRPDVVVLAFFLRNDVIDNSARLGTNPRIYFDFDARGKPQPLPFSAARAEHSSWLNHHSRFYVWQKSMFAQMRGRWGRLDRSRLTYVGEPDGELAHAWELTAALLALFRDEVRADGARFLVAALPGAELVYDEVWKDFAARSRERDRFDRESPQRRIEEICRAAGIDLATMTAAFRAAAARASSAVAPELLYFDGIGHFNARGNELAAEAVATAVRDLFG
jgi:lysophospholipase L1-like esterase